MRLEAQTTVTLVADIKDIDIIMTGLRAGSRLHKSVMVDPVKMNDFDTLELKFRKELIRLGLMHEEAKP